MQSIINLIDALENDDRSTESNRAVALRRPEPGNHDWARFGQRPKARKSINGAHRRGHKRSCA